MALHKVVVPISTYVENLGEASFGFEALSPRRPTPTVSLDGLVSPDDVYLLISGFGAMGSGPFVLTVRLNGTELGMYQFDRWVTHTIMVSTTKLVHVPRGIVQVGVSLTGPTGTPNNTISLEPLFAEPFFFIGPVICHY